MGTTTTLAIECADCKQLYSFEVPIEGYKLWQAGELIQRAMPQVDYRDRELLISGTCDSCFRAMFGDEEE